MSNPDIDAAWSIDTLLERHPALFPVLSAYGIDTCCGGPLAIREVSARHKIELATLLDALARATQAR
ncbi:MAG TPA: hypothetical protein VHE78_03020 [Gemmatimonadaceae bacterium]|nr:hypothetical protein [Gemmatimonadaceae bacterium]